MPGRISAMRSSSTSTSARTAGPPLPSRTCPSAINTRVIASLRSFADSEAIETVGPDRIAAEQLVALRLVQPGGFAQAEPGLDNVRIGAGRMGIVDLEQDLIHADQVAAHQRGVVVENAAVDMAGDVAARRLRRALVARPFL